MIFEVGWLHIVLLRLNLIWYGFEKTERHSCLLTLKKRVCGNPFVESKPWSPDNIIDLVRDRYKIIPVEIRTKYGVSDSSQKSS